MLDKPQSIVGICVAISVFARVWEIKQLKIRNKIISVPINGIWRMREMETDLPSCETAAIVPGVPLTHAKQNFPR